MESFSWDIRYFSEAQPWDRPYHRQQAQEDGAGKAWAPRGRECVITVRAAVERMGQGLRPPQGLGSMRNYWEVPVGGWLVALLTTRKQTKIRDSAL